MSNAMTSSRSRLLSPTTTSPRSTLELTSSFDPAPRHSPRWAISCVTCTQHRDSSTNSPEGSLSLMPNTVCLIMSDHTRQKPAKHLLRATPSEPTALSSPGICPHSTHICTTATWMSPQSKNSQNGGTRAATLPHRAKTADTEHSPTSSSPSLNSASTVAPCLYPEQAPPTPISKHPPPPP